MTISEVVAVELINTDGIVEKYDFFSNTERTFNKGQRLIDDDIVYERVGDDIVVADYDANNDNYKLNEVVFKDSTLQYVSNTVGTVAKQPEEYSNFDTDITLEALNRYFKVNTNFTKAGSEYRYATTLVINNKNYVVVYRFIENNSTVDVKVLIYKLDTAKRGFCPTDCSNSDAQAHFYYEKFSNTEYKENYAVCIGRPTEPRAYTLYSNNIFIDSNYNSLILNITELTCSGNTYYKADYYTKTGGYEYSVDLHTQSYLNISEEKAQTVNSNPYIYKPMFFIKRGSDLYFRTAANIPQETKTITEIQLSQLNNINDCDWGWVAVAPSQKTAPFDIKSYTKVVQHNIIKYTVKAKDIFDVIVANKLIASKVDVKIGEDSYSFTPKCVYEDSILDTTAIYYLNKTYPKDTVIEVTLYPLENTVELGMALLGKKRFLGWTLKKFSVDIKDFSVYEQDEFGNINYVERAKLNRVNYTVDVETKNFDYTQKTLKKLTGHIVIIDGTDNLENNEIDNLKYFEALSMVGRFRNPKISTNITEENRLKSVATYTFEAEELV